MIKHKIDIPELPQEKEYIIAYIDILGTTDRLSKKDASDIFTNIYYPFLLADRIIPEIEFFKAEEIKIKIFSDNILFAYPISDASDKNKVFKAYEKICNVLNFVLHMFLNKGILFRGAITIGKLQINDLLVWGKGLVEVVRLEENVAIYPRIILSEKLLKIFDEFSLSGFQYEIKFSCLKDTDNCVFFNYFNYDDTEAMDSSLYYAKKHIDEAIKNEQCGDNRVKVLQKYYWHKNFLLDIEMTYTKIQRNKDLSGRPRL